MSRKGSTPGAPVPTHRFSERYRDLMERACGVIEEQAQYRGVPIRERVVRCIWYRQIFGKDALRTVDGEALRVMTPGWWNVEGGPDFLKAELIFGDGLMHRGDVEVHLHSSDWYRHGHHEDPRYNDVLLHVALWHDVEDDFVVAQAGHPVRQLVIEDHLGQSLGSVIESLEHEDYPEPKSPTAGLCQRYLDERRVAESWVAHLLEAAGDERVLRKASALARRATQVGEDQAFYEGFMAALGYKRNKDSFVRLACAVPLVDLKDAGLRSVREIQAVLFHAADLLPEERPLPGMPDEATSDLLHTYDAVLKRVRRAPTRLSREDWHFSGTRPVNFPTRRIAAASHFLAQHLEGGLVQAMVDVLPADVWQCPEPLGAARARDIRRRISRALELGDDPYWSRRCVFGGKETGAMRLLGQERISVILVNVAVPVLLARARATSDLALESAVHQVYDSFPALVGTNITRFMSARIFGDAAAAERLATSARRQQGLYQLYADFERDDRSCEECAFARAILQAGDGR